MHDMKELDACNGVAAHINDLTVRMRDWRSADPSQVRALKRIGLFFLLMLAFTLVARGTAGATMPVVTIAKATMDTIEQAIHASGVIAPTASVNISAPESLLVQDVLVTEGVQINAGDTIARYYADAVDGEMARQKAKLTELNKQLSVLRKNEAVDPSAVENAQQELAMAQQDYDALIADYDAVSNKMKKQRARVSRLDDEYSSLKDNAQADPAAVESARQNMESAQAQLDSLSTDRDAISKSMEDAQRNIEKAQLSVLQAERSYSQAAEDARYTQSMNSAQAGNVKLDISDVQKRIEELTAIQNNEYQLLAEQGGIVQAVNIAAGSPSQRIACTLEDTSQGYLFSFVLTKEQAQNVSYGTKMTVSQGTEEEDCGVFGMSGPDAAGDITVTARLNRKTWQAGQAEVRITLSRNNYPYTLPISAVHTDNAGSFVFIVEEHKTTLGLSNVLVRIPVKIEETCETKAAVTGALTSDESVVSTSTKPITQGCKVRVGS